MRKCTLALLLLFVLAAFGGCDRPPEHRLAQVDLDSLMEESDRAASYQQELDERGEELEEYYQQLDLDGPETEDQYSVYQDYQQEVSEIQERFDEAIAAAIEEMDGSERFDAVVTAEAAYVVEEDITEQVAEIMDGDEGGESEANGSEEDGGDHRDEDE